VTLAWLSKCRAILVGSDKKACNYLGCSGSLVPRSGFAPTAAWTGSASGRDAGVQPGKTG
jgi:hypothetical protein